MDGDHLAQFRAAYYEASGQVSDISRQLCFAGIALIWLFRDETASPALIPQTLVLPALLLAISLALDLGQYLVKAVSWGVFARYHETRETMPDGAPRWINWVPLALFALKIAASISAYYFIANYLWNVYWQG